MTERHGFFSRMKLWSLYWERKRKSALPKEERRSVLDHLSKCLEYTWIRTKLGPCGPSAKGVPEAGEGYSQRVVVGAFK